MDIGCGIAGIDVLIDQHNKGSDLEIYLLDKSKVDKKIDYGYNKSSSFYNSLSIARSLLIENGIDASRIHTQEVDDSCKIHFNEKFDIIISLISWGYHYPVSTYLDQVYEMLKKGGILIMDIQNKYEGFDEIERKFGNIKSLSFAPKLTRILARK